jgi:fatty-acyl-CoA synthase
VATWFGAKQIFPRHDLGGEAICKMIETEKVTFTAGVPTLMQGILRHVDSGAKTDLSSLRMIICGGSAVPRSLNKAYIDRFGVPLTQAYGMTETSPMLVISNLKSHMDDWSEDDQLEVLAKQGTLVPGLEMKIVNDKGEKLDHDGVQVGEILVRGPWITAEYYNEPEKTKELIVDGWLRTGDIAKIDPEGYIQIVDRSKDLIKSGGEWISSVDLENTIMGHPDVAEAAVVAIPDEKWDERPMAVVALKKGASVTDKDILEYLTDKIVKWWMPDKVIFIDELPKTSVGKFDKKALRREYVD